MKKIILLVCAISGLTLATQAQNEPRPGKMPKLSPEQHHMMMLKQLNLTQEQQEKLNANREEFKAKLKELGKNENVTLKEYRDKKEALQKEEKEKMLALLTPEQKAKMEQLKKDDEAKREQMADQRLEKLKIKLALTDDQVAKIKADRKERQEKIAAIRDNEKLSRTERKAKLEALKEQYKDGIKKYLTADQAKKFDELKKNKSVMEKGKPGKAKLPKEPA